MSNSIIACGLAIWISIGPVLMTPPPAQKTDNSPAVISQKKTVSQQDQAVIDDIAHLRQLVGGSPFALEVDGFKDALTNYVDEPVVDTTWKTVQDTPGATAPQINSQKSMSADLVEHLRVSSELLEQRANRLERANEFEKADNLRKLANRIRRQARQL